MQYFPAPIMVRGFFSPILFHPKRFVFVFLMQALLLSTEQAR